MIAELGRSDDDRASLRELLAAAARRASDVQVAWYAGAGVVIVAAAVAFHPPAWLAFAALGTCIGTFGVWGMADHELRDRAHLAPAMVVALTAVRVLAAIAGGASALLILFLALGTGLGTWKS